MSGAVLEADLQEVSVGKGAYSCSYLKVYLEVNYTTAKQAKLMCYWHSIYSYTYNGTFLY